MVKNATSWLQEDHSWRKTTRHGHSCALFANRNLRFSPARKATFRGNGLHPDAVGASWEKIREMFYGGRDE